MRTALAALTVCLLALPAQAKYSGGTGEPNDPYQIATAADLIALGQTPEDYDKHFILTADIDLDPNLPGRRMFDRAVIAADTSDVGSDHQSSPFTGVFDGGRHTISHLTITGGSDLGLFGQLDHRARVSNLGLEAVEIIGTGSFVGGLVGYNYGTLTQCNGTGAVNGNDDVGGLVGYNGPGGSITESYCSNSVSGNDDVGGLAGYNAIGSSISYSYSSGSVSGNNSVGGLVGGNSQGDFMLAGGSITSSYSNSSVSGTYGVGGLVGRNGRPFWAGGSITSSYSNGSVNGTGLSVGGLVGYNWGSIRSSFWDIQTSTTLDGVGYSPFSPLDEAPSGTGGVEGKTTAEMKTTRTFLLWGTCDNRGTWTIDEGNDYPRLAWERRPGIVLDFRLSDFLEGSGTGDDPYRIYTADDIETIASFPCEQDRHFRLAFLEGTGTEDDPYLIYTVDQINMINSCARYVADAHFRLMFADGRGTKDSPYLLATADDLYMIGMFQWGWDKHYELVADIDLSRFDGKDGRPAFKGIGTFTGIFDGDGHSILHLTTTGSLFGMVESDAEVRNLAVMDVNIVASGLVGRNSGALIRCSITGTIKGTQYVGGLVGYNEGSIASSYSNASVSGTSYNVGGLVGYNSGNITTSYSAGSVSGQENVGGLVGCNSGNITTSYSSGVVCGIGNTGGLVGGGGGSVLYSVWDVETSGLLGSAGGVGLTTAEMMDPYMLGLNGFANDPNWVLDAGRDYPHLALDGAAGTIIAEPTIDWLEGTGDVENPYRIYIAEQLFLLAKASILCGMNFVLDADIDLDPNLPGGQVFAQAVIPSFEGIFDGGGHLVSRLTITGNSRLGLFGRLESGAEVKNLVLVDVNIVGLGGYLAGNILVSGSYIGGVVGFNSNGTITNCSSLDVNILASGSYIGGLVGCNSHGTIANCSSSGMVSGAYDDEWVAGVGGLVGNNLGGTLVQCYSIAVTRGNGGVGGLVGGNGGIVTQCYSKGMVSGDQTVGGLSGNNCGTVTQCYSVGTVSGDRSVGGMVGFRCGGNASQCFWDTQISGQATSAYGTGLTTAEMQTASTFLDAGWDFVGETVNGTEDIWWIDEGQDYPRLWWEAVEE